MITVIDYGAGNLRSVCNALAVLGAPFEIVATPGPVETAEAILLPGVGHFGQMVQALGERALVDPLRRKLDAGTPYLGICLGMQALFNRSEEAPEAEGLGLLAGEVKRFPATGRVPHMGWTAVEPRSGAEIAGPGMFYFAHSFYVPEHAPGAAATARHGFAFTAVVEHAHLAGCQFHPEKSGQDGLEFLKRWINKCRQNA